MVNRPQGQKRSLRGSARMAKNKIFKWGSSAQKAALEKARKASAEARRRFNKAGGNTAVLRARRGVQKTARRVGARASVAKARATNTIKRATNTVRRSSAASSVRKATGRGTYSGRGSAPGAAGSAGAVRRNTGKATYSGRGKAPDARRGRTPSAVVAANRRRSEAQRRINARRRR